MRISRGDTSRDREVLIICRSFFQDILKGEQIVKKCFCVEIKDTIFRAFSTAVIKETTIFISTQVFFESQHAPDFPVFPLRLKEFSCIQVDVLHHPFKVSVVLNMFRAEWFDKNVSYMFIFYIEIHRKACAKLTHKFYHTTFSKFFEQDMKVIRHD